MAEWFEIYGRVPVHKAVAIYTLQYGGPTRRAQPTSSPPPQYA